jgi:hypothetical protein
VDSEQLSKGEAILGDISTTAIMKLENAEEKEKEKETSDTAPWNLLKMLILLKCVNWNKRTFLGWTALPISRSFYRCLKCYFMLFMPFYANTHFLESFLKWVQPKTSWFWSLWYLRYRMIQKNMIIGGNFIWKRL